MSREKQGGIVYVLENAAMPGIVKIGRTSRDTVEDRLNELYSTSVPVPFDCVYAARVTDEEEVERAIHDAFGPDRINPKREFFEIESFQAIAVLRLVATDDVTPEIQKEAAKVDVESHAGAKKLKSRGPRLNFAEMGIPVGAMLKFKRNDIEVEVVSHNRVKYRDKEYSLTAVTKQLLEISHAPATATNWTYQGKLLREIYKETYFEIL